MCKPVPLNRKRGKKTERHGFLSCHLEKTSPEKDMESGYLITCAWTKAKIYRVKLLNCNLSTIAYWYFPKHLCGIFVLITALDTILYFLIFHLAFCQNSALLYTYSKKQCGLKTARHIYFKLILDLGEVALTKICWMMQNIIFRKDFD